MYLIKKCFYVHKSDYMCVQRKKTDVVGEFEENFHHLIEHLFVQKLGRGPLKSPADVTFKILYNDHSYWQHSELMCRVFNLLLPVDKIPIYPTIYFEI